MLAAFFISSGFSRHRNRGDGYRRLERYLVQARSLEATADMIAERAPSKQRNAAAYRQKLFIDLCR
jgi:hypothetical protein